MQMWRSVNAQMRMACDEKAPCLQHYESWEHGGEFEWRTTIKGWFLTVREHAEVMNS